MRVFRGRAQAPNWQSASRKKPKKTLAFGKHLLYNSHVALFCAAFWWVSAGGCRI